MRTKSEHFSLAAMMPFAKNDYRETKLEGS